MAKKKRPTQWTSPSGATYTLGSATPATDSPNLRDRSASGYGNNLAAGDLSDAAERIVKANNGRHRLLRTIR